MTEKRTEKQQIRAEIRAILEVYEEIEVKGGNLFGRLSPNPPKGACERRPEETKGCTFESEIMVLNQKNLSQKRNIQ